MYYINPVKTLLAIFVVIISFSVYHRESSIFAFDKDNQQQLKNLNSTIKEIILVDNSKPASTIVISKNPTKAVQLAVKELNHHLAIITGTRLPVVNEDQMTKGIQVLVGESHKTREIGLFNKDFRRQEFLVQSRPGMLILMGFDGSDRGEIAYDSLGTWKGFNFFHPVGSLYAVYEFLEKFCDVRWYLPTDIGTVIPKKRTLAFKNINIRRKPWTEYRNIWPRVLPDDLGFWDVKNKQLGKTIKRLSSKETTLYWLRLRIGGDPFAANHSFTHWAERFSKTHPEYFAQGVPRYRNTKRWQINYSKDEVVDQVVNDISAYLRGKKLDEKGIPIYPSAKNNVFPVVPNDSKRWSHDDISKKMLLNEPRRVIGHGFNNDRASNYVFTFVNRVAKKVKKIDPDVLVSTLAYGDYFFPPENVNFESNVTVMVCKQQVKARTRRYDEIYFQALKKWSTLVKHLYVWEYYNLPQFRRMNVFPGLVPHRIGEDTERLKRLRIDGEFIEINMAEGFKPFEKWLVNPAMQHINYYFTLKLLDDPNCTIQSLLNEYYRLFYGPAGELMQDFFTEMERTYLKEKCFKEYEKLDATLSWTCYCNSKILARFENLIEKAKKRTNGLEPYHSRVQLIDRSVYQFMAQHSQKYH